MFTLIMTAVRLSSVGVIVCYVLPVEESFMQGCWGEVCNTRLPRYARSSQLMSHGKLEFHAPVVVEYLEAVDVEDANDCLMSSDDD